MKTKVLITIAICFCIHCGTTSNPDKLIETKWLDLKGDLLTQEVSIDGNDEALSDEFLMVQPRVVISNSIGDILLYDEGKLKVYDNSGRQKIIVGSQGEGPGEYGRSILPYFTPGNQLIVMNAGRFSSQRITYWGKSRPKDFYNLFASDYSFIEKKRFDSNPLIAGYFSERDPEEKFRKRIIKYIPLNDHEKIYHLEIDDTKTVAYEVLLYQKNDTIITLLETTKIESAAKSSIDEDIGWLHWEVFADGKIFYIDTYNDFVDENGFSYYTAGIITLKNLKKKIIKHAFMPVKFSKFKLDYHIPTSAPPQIMKGLLKIRETYRSKKYNPSVKCIKIDNETIFVFLSNEGSSQAQADVFDLNKGEYIHSINFPFIPNDIKTGYAYQLKMGYTDFPQIEKHRIDPAVYRK